MFVKPLMLNEDQRKDVSEMFGKIMLWILEGRSIWYMANELHLKPYEVQSNIDEMLYILRKQVGNKRFLKTLFCK